MATRMRNDAAIAAAGLLAAGADGAPCAIGAANGTHGTQAVTIDARSGEIITARSGGQPDRATRTGRAAA